VCLVLFFLFLGCWGVFFWVFWVFVGVVCVLFFPLPLSTPTHLVEAQYLLCFKLVTDGLFFFPLLLVSASAAPARICDGMEGGVFRLILPGASFRHLLMFATLSDLAAKRFTILICPPLLRLFFFPFFSFDGHPFLSRLPPFFLSALLPHQSFLIRFSPPRWKSTHLLMSRSVKNPLSLPPGSFPFRLVNCSHIIPELSRFSPFYPRQASLVKFYAFPRIFPQGDVN